MGIESLLLAPDYVEGKPVCPMCRAPAEAEFVDNGVGDEQVTPYRCTRCDWTQQSADDFLDVRDL